MALPVRPTQHLTTERENSPSFQINPQQLEPLFLKWIVSHVERLSSTLDQQTELTFFFLIF